MNRIAVSAIAIAAAAVIGGLGFWLGHNPGSSNSVSELSNTPATEQAPPAAPAVGHWNMEAQFEGPLKDTVVQRWKDPTTGILCYIYLPVLVQHAPPLENGMVHYGGNDTGTISCVKPG